MTADNCLRIIILNHSYIPGCPAYRGLINHLVVQPAIQVSGCITGQVDCPRGLIHDHITCRWCLWLYYSCNMDQVSIAMLFSCLIYVGESLGDYDINGSHTRGMQYLYSCQHTTIITVSHPCRHFTLLCEWVAMIIIHYSLLHSQ